MGLRYDVTRLTPGGVEVYHHSGAFRTDGPFLVLYGPDDQIPECVIPSHALGGMDLCRDDATCRVRPARGDG